MCVLSHQAQLGKESACNAEGLGSIPGLGRSPGERKGYLLQYSGLENPMVCIVHEVTKSWTLLDPTDCSLPGSSVHARKGKNTGVGCHALLQGIFLSQGSKLCPLSLQHYQADSFLTVSSEKPFSNYYIRNMYLILN